MKVRHITQYLFESYKDAQAKFLQEASEEEVNQYLDTFKKLANQNKITGQEKDIGYWIKQGWNNFKDFVDKKSEEPSKTDMKNDSIVKEFLKKLNLTSNALIRIIKYAKNGEYIFKYYDFEKLLNAKNMYKAIRMNPEILNVIDRVPQNLKQYIKDNDGFELPQH